MMKKTSRTYTPKTNGGTIHLHRPHPAKFLFLALTLILGGCASRPADLVTKDSPTHYWKWIAEQKSWIYFDSFGRKIGAVDPYNGVFLVQQRCHPISLKEMSNMTGTAVAIVEGVYYQDEPGYYDTALHAQAALEKVCR